ncbi:hypothetical protein KSU03_09415 [Fusobacterium polymorphum]|jgi:hypothetical protein|uniref:Uncharacterized protein n=1 Tax=Fusobacterium nucleatum subsp. polymorphum TaxID=76857 RepID=A0A2C6BWW2_FUSNP|nr:hypothetical protein [Fusobacterium polymorphum]PHI08352.1 hypothetical protein CBG52_09290 [Fusobacterium polymorphum]
MKDRNYLSNQYHENRDFFYKNGKKYTKLDAEIWDNIKDLERIEKNYPLITHKRAQELFDEYKDIFDDKD